AAVGRNAIRPDGIHLRPSVSAALHGGGAYDARDAVARPSHRAQPRQRRRGAALWAPVEERVSERAPDPGTVRVRAESGMNSAPDELSRQTDAGPAAPGELLRACRERRGLTIRRAVDELQVVAWLVGEIVRERYVVLGR